MDEQGCSKDGGKLKSGTNAGKRKKNYHTKKGKQSVGKISDPLVDLFNSLILFCPFRPRCLVRTEAYDGGK